MKPPVAVRIAARELRGGISGFAVFLLCLTLGVGAIAAVGSVQSAIDAGLRREGAVLLGGDGELQITYRRASAAELAWMGRSATAVSEIIDFRSMATVTNEGVTERALSQVKAVDGAYPLKGSVTLDPPMTLADALAGRDGLPGAVLHPVLRDRLGLHPGDVVRYGTRDFVFAAAIAHEPDDAGAGFALGPRTILRTDALEGSGLLAAGTLFDAHYRMEFAPGADLAALKADALDALGDQGLRWRDRRNGAPGVGTFVDRLGAFLVLVGLAGLAVGGVGVAAAVRAYLETKTEAIAVLKTLGASGGTILAAYALQIAALTILGVGLGVVSGALLPLALAPLVAGSLPLPAVFSIYSAPLAEAALYGFLTAGAFTLWPLARTESVRPAALFRDRIEGRAGVPRLRHIVLTVVLAGLLVGSAAWFSDAAVLALWTAGGILGALVLLVLAALLSRRVANRFARMRALRGRTALRLAFGAIGGPRSDAVPVVLSLGLGLAVLAAVGQIDANLRAAIARDLPGVAPSYFFLDIQGGQLPGFLERTTGDPAVSRVETAPMLRGIITRINDRPAREVAGDHWVLRGDRGVTFSQTLPSGTTLTAGAWWPADYEGEPLASFAAEEAAEMGLKLGDRLTINVLGRDVTARLASFREVDFSNAGMGFVLAVNPTALAGAPYSAIATVYAEEAAEAAILRDLASAYPNITAIRVRDAIERVSAVLTGIATATATAASATLLTGFVVLIGAAAAGERARVFEAAVLKTLGATRARVLASFALRAGLLGAAAGIVAIIAGAAAGWAVLTFVMETTYVFAPGSAIAIVAGGAGATLLAGLAFAARPLAARPAQVLRARE